MDPTTNTVIGDVLDPEAFYDGLASSYDLMTGFETRFARERAAFERIVAEHQIRTAIDAGAGTGFHALLLAQLGVDVTATDISEKMLGVVQHHASELHVPVRTLRTSFQELSRGFPGQVDAVFCLGNSLVHLLSDDDVARVLSNFASVLRPGGLLMVQILNYRKILASRERIVGVQQRGDSMFVRFYDFVDPLLQFNILHLRRERENWKAELRSTLLRPVWVEDFERHLPVVGFSQVTFSGGISREEFLLDQSRDLIVAALRQEM
jgi:glycine/sarcosine N-methyltransferase